MPVLDNQTLSRLLGSMEGGQLVLLCGAGLSIPAPSNLMSAVAVARACYDKWLPVEQLPPPLRDHVDALAGHFHANGTLKSVFIRRLVPWDDLVGEPNAGHAAVGDFLVCRAAHAALSANFDPLIEQWCHRHKVAMRGALTGTEAIAFSDRTNPLLKFHGCFHRGPEDTLWTQAQLSEQDIQARVQNCSQWMSVTLPGKDLLVVGFWTDWSYLNEVLANALQVQNANSVTVIDPQSDGQLQQKAPVLWQKLTNAGGPFTHIQASGADALEELRTEFSKVWARRFFALAAQFVEQAGGPGGAVTCSPDNWTGDDLYDLRRDAEGVPYSRAAERKQPPQEAGAAAHGHALLTQAGATRKGSIYTHNGVTIRVVHGAGQTLEWVRERYKEPPSISAADIIICAGAQTVGTPATVIATGSGASVVRPAAGGGSRWLTLEEARAELQL